MVADDAPLIIGGRASPLALWQSHLVQERVCQATQMPIDRVPVKGLKSEADNDLVTPLSQFTNKGVFTQNLDRALAMKEIDLAVHSCKDLPSTLPPGLVLAAILARQHRHDVLVLNDKANIESLNDLPAGTRIGTSSVRRRALLAHHYPHLVCVEVRGNIQTRLKHMESGKADGVILAAAALHRLKLQDRISVNLLDWPYAVSQGALAVVCRQDDERSLAVAQMINDSEDFMVCVAERALLRTLEGGCKVPIGVNVDYDVASQNLTIYGVVVGLEGKNLIEDTLIESCKSISDAESIGHKLGLELKKKGASELLQQIRKEVESFIIVLTFSPHRVMLEMFQRLCDCPLNPKDLRNYQKFLVRDERIKTGTNGKKIRNEDVATCNPLEDARHRQGGPNRYRLCSAAGFADWREQPYLRPLFWVSVGI